MVERPVPAFGMALMLPSIGASSAGRFPLSWALPIAEYAQPVCLPRRDQVFLAVAACPTLQASRAPVGSPLFIYQQFPLMALKSLLFMATA